MELPLPAAPFCLPKLDKQVCAVCQHEAAPGETLKRCQKCRTVPYCLRQCQVADWKQHKQVCLKYKHDGSLNYTGMNLSENGPKGKKAQGARTRGDVLNDLTAWAQEHNGDTLTVACWQAMDLMTNIRKAETHFLGVTLRKNAVWTNRRAMYSLMDAEVLPLTLLSTDKVQFHRERDKRRRVADGALRSVLVMSLELAPDENMTVEEAVVKRASLATAGLFRDHKNTLGALLPFAHSFWKRCMKNALDGGAYSVTYQPWPAATS